MNHHVYKWDINMGHTELRCYFDGMIGMVEEKEFDQFGTLLSTVTKPSGVVLTYA